MGRTPRLLKIKRENPVGTNPHTESAAGAFGIVNLRSVKSLLGNGPRRADADTGAAVVPGTAVGMNFSHRAQSIRTCDF